MNQTDKLINELHKACRAAIVGIDNLKTDINSEKLQTLIKKQNEFYEKFLSDIKKTAINYEIDPDDISVFMKANSFLMSKMETMIDGSDEKIAEIMINGTKMGIKQMDEIIHEFEDADEEILNYAKKFKESLEEFLNSLREFV